jgi:hypothetical protein
MTIEYVFDNKLPKRYYGGVRAAMARQFATSGSDAFGHDF